MLSPKAVASFKSFNINVEDFFNSPYEVYPDRDMYDLRYYTTPKAIKIYGTYISQKNNECPDARKWSGSSQAESAGDLLPN